MSDELPAVWQVATNDQAALIAMAGGELAVRFDDSVAGFDPDTGAQRLNVSLGASSLPSFLLVDGTQLFTNTRHGPQRSTQVVAIRDGRIMFRGDLHARVPKRAAVLVGQRLFAVGDDLRGGAVLRAIDARGNRVLNVKLVPDERDLYSHDGDLVILNSTSEPGLYTMTTAGDRGETLITSPVQEVRLTRTHILAAVRSVPGVECDIQLYRSGSRTPVWTHRGYGPILGLDEEHALHVARPSDRQLVCRDLATGDERWRAPLPDDSGEVVCSRHVVVFNHGTGVSLYCRADGRVLAELALVRAFDVAGTLYLSGMDWFAVPRPEAQKG